MRARWAICLGAASVMLGACSSGGDSDVAAEATATNGFVGELDGTDAYVAVIADDDSAEVYACDGENGIAARFAGSIDDPATFTLTNDAGGEAIVEFVDGAFSGEVMLADGSTHSFSTDAAVGDAGLFHLTDPPGDMSAGWVVLNDGTQRGSFGGVASGGVYVVPGPPINGASGQVGTPPGWRGTPQVGLNFDRARP